jgi:hypothetical protein
MISRLAWFVTKSTFRDALFFRNAWAVCVVLSTLLMLSILLVCIKHRTMSDLAKWGLRRCMVIHVLITGLYALFSLYADYVAFNPHHDGPVADTTELLLLTRLIVEAPIVVPVWLVPPLICYCAMSLFELKKRWKQGA